MGIKKELFGRLNGQDVYRYTLTNDQGMEVSCIDYGCIITKINVPDEKGKVENVVLGFDTLEEYLKYSPYFGAVCGRVAGRISSGKFSLDGKEYQLATNNGDHHLHGGVTGFDKVVWNTTVAEDRLAIEFSRLSIDGEEGYPGNLESKVTYTLSNDNTLTINYEAETDKPTLVNLTNHTYFNLSGDAKRDILNHQLQLKSDRFIELSNGLVPTGNQVSVEGTPFDFRNGQKLVNGVNSEHDQNRLVGAGYDHPFLLNTNNDREIVLEDEDSGRRLIIETDQPSVVIYSGNQLQDHYKIGNVQSRKYLGLCLEVQGLPDAINHDHFPSVVLREGETYRSKSTYTFELMN